MITQLPQLFLLITCPISLVLLYIMAPAVIISIILTYVIIDTDKLAQSNYNTI